MIKRRIAEAETVLEVEMLENKTKNRERVPSL